MTEQKKDNSKELSLVEQSLQNILSQKQNFQTQILELENALKELKTSEVSYKMVANILVKADKETLKKDLEEKLEVFNLRIKAIEKQESKLQEKAQSLQSEFMKNIENGN